MENPDGEKARFAGVYRQSRLLVKVWECLHNYTNRRQNNISSSANVRWIRLCWHLRWYLNLESMMRDFKSSEKYSIHKIKRKGEIGSPCLNPSFPRKKPWRQPLMDMKGCSWDTFHDPCNKSNRKTKLHEDLTVEVPQNGIISLPKIDFEKASWCDFHAGVLSNKFLSKKMLSVMQRPFTKANLATSIKLSNTVARWSERIFEMILYHYKNPPI